MLGKALRAEREVTEYLWPDNVATWRCWTRVRTQWRVGMAGATGLDYAGVRAFLEEQGLDESTRREVFEGIQVCEAATLEVWAEQRAEEQERESAPAFPFPPSRR